MAERFNHTDCDGERLSPCGDVLPGATVPFGWRERFMSFPRPRNPVQRRLHATVEPDKVLVAPAGFSCQHACYLEGMTCDDQLLREVNNCTMLMKHFRCGWCNIWRSSQMGACLVPGQDSRGGCHIVGPSAATSCRCSRPTDRLLCACTKQLV